MSSRLRVLFCAPLLALMLPALGSAVVVPITTATVNFGGSASGSINTTTSVGTDQYSITGSYFDYYDASGTHVGFFPTVTLLSASAATTDSVTVRLSQDFFDNSPGTWDGTYTETIPLSLSAGVSGGGELFVDGQGVGALGPQAGPGSFVLTGSKALSGLTGDTLTEVYDITFTFQAGTLAGASGSSVPEPAETVSLGIGLASLILFKIRKARIGAGK